ncbi:C2H2-type domain-containing protein [Camponotus japonicus]
MAQTTPWKWNYFTLESLSIIKCSLCDSVFTPRLVISRDLRRHLSHNKDTKHQEACKTLSHPNQNQKGTLRWDSHYNIESSNIILKPNIKCKYCKVDIPILNDKPFVRAPRGLDEHLKTAHNIEFTNFKALRKWIYKIARDYNIIPRDNMPPSIKKVWVIKVDTCRKCNVKIGAKNAIMFVKHLIEKHFEIETLPSDIIPNELLLNYDSDDRFEDICTDDPSEPHISSREQLQTMEENLKRMHECAINAVKNLKKMKKN